MEKPNSYCEVVKDMEEDSLHRTYHDTAYGFPIEDDNELFERLILEINQAGLSWITILKKQDNFKEAYHQFDIATVANYQQTDIERLLANEGIIRNKLKILSAIYNAQTILKLQAEFGSFKGWLDYHHPLKKEDWVKIFRKIFKFTGGEIVNEFLMSTGYLPNAHKPDCPIHLQIIQMCPPWMVVSH